MSEQRREVGRVLLQHGVAFTWGFAEATVFFVVPDAWTSAVGLRRPARAQSLTLTATAGAALGGVAVHRWAASTDPERSAALAARIPAIRAVTSAITASSTRMVRARRPRRVRTSLAGREGSEGMDAS